MTAVSVQAALLRSKVERRFDPTAQPSLPHTNKGRRLLREAARRLGKGTRVRDHMTDSACDAKTVRFPAKTETCRRYAEIVRARLERVILSAHWPVSRL